VKKHCKGDLCLDNAFALIEGHPSKPREEDSKTQVLKTKPGAPLKTEGRRPEDPGFENQTLIG
jgi:hypothetical protein